MSGGSWTSTKLKATYPNASFHFIGHSNGTYILSQALEQYHGVTFDRVAFAGSVVPTTFPWSAYAGRITAIRNYRASNDLVVAALPSVFEHIPWFLEVGGAGHAGFLDDFARQDQSRFFADGGHGAVLEHPENYTTLVKYILGATVRRIRPVTHTSCRRIGAPPASRRPRSSSIASA